MKKVVFHKSFDKNFAKRISKNTKLKKQFNSIFTEFLTGKRDYPLNDHSLTGTMEGKRSFSVANNVRVVYRETADELIFLDIGTHNQVYK